MNTKSYNLKTDDVVLIEHALHGDKNALATLIKKHQDWIYNVSLNFVGDQNDASDLTQEVLIKTITKLDTFRKESSFKTWVYRIIKNHFLNMKRGKFENGITFEQFGQGLDQIPDESLNDYSYEIENKLLVKEAKISCMKGMLLCLDREQRLIYIIGELFGFKDTIGSEIMEITKENFRVKLHRARKQLYNFMNDKCGLINKSNPCRCAKKTAGFIKMGYVNPDNLYFQKHIVSKVDDSIKVKLDHFQNDIMGAYQKLFLEHPRVEFPDNANLLKNILHSDMVKKTFNL